MNASISSKARKNSHPNSDEINGMSSKNGGRSAKGSLHRLDSVSRFKLGLTKYDLIMYLLNLSIAGFFSHWNQGLSCGFPAFLVATFVVGSAAVSNGVNSNELTTAFPYSGGIFGFSRVALGHYVAYTVATCEIIAAVMFLSITSLTLGKLVTSMDPPQWSEAQEPAVWVVYSLFLGVLFVYGGKYVFVLQKTLCILSLIIFLIFCLGSLKFVDFMENAPFHESSSAGLLGASDGIKKWFNDGMDGFLYVLPFAFWFFQAIPSVSVTADDSDDPKTSFPFATNSVIILLVPLVISVLFIWTSLPPGLSTTDARMIAPFNVGFSLMFHTKSPLVSLLTIPAIVTSGFGFIFTVSKLLFCLAQAKIFSKWFLRRDSKTGVPYIAVLVGVMTSLSCCFVVFYLQNVWKKNHSASRLSDISLLFNIAVLSCIIVYTVQCACYISLQYKFANLTRSYTSPLGVCGSVYACCVWLACVVAIAVFQRDGHVSVLVFLGLVALASAYYHFVAKDSQIISKAETKVLFTAHVINCKSVGHLSDKKIKMLIIFVLADNIKKSRRGSRHTGVGADDSMKTPRLLRLMTPTTLRQFSAENGLNMDIPNFMRSRSNASPTRTRSAYKMNDGMKTFPSSNDMTADMNSSKNTTSSKTSRFLSLFSARRSESSASLTNPYSSRGYFWSGKARDANSARAATADNKESSPRNGNGMEYTNGVRLPRMIHQDSAQSISGGNDVPREAERPISAIPEGGESSKSLAFPVIGAITNNNNSHSHSHNSSQAHLNSSRSRSVGSSNNNSPVVVHAVVPGAGNNTGRSIGGSSGSGIGASRESPKESSPRSENAFSRHSSDQSQEKSGTHSFHNVSQVQSQAHSRDDRDGGVDYGHLLQGLDLDDLLKLDPVYQGPFKKALHRTITEAAGGGEMYSDSDEDDDDDDEVVVNSRIPSRRASSSYANMPRSQSHSSAPDEETGGLASSGPALSSKNNKFKGTRLNTSDGFEEFGQIVDDSPKGSEGNSSGVHSNHFYGAGSSKSSVAGGSPTAGDAGLFGRLTSGMGMFGRLLSGGTTKTQYPSSQAQNLTRGFSRESVGSNKGPPVTATGSSTIALGRINTSNSLNGGLSPLGVEPLPLHDIDEECGSPSPDASARHHCSPGKIMLSRVSSNAEEASPTKVQLSRTVSVEQPPKSRPVGMISPNNSNNSASSNNGQGSVCIYEEVVASSPILDNSAPPSIQVVAVPVSKFPPNSEASRRNSSSVNSARKSPSPTKSPITSRNPSPNVSPNISPNISPNTSPDKAAIIGSPQLASRFDEKESDPVDSARKSISSFGSGRAGYQQLSQQTADFYNNNNNNQSSGSLHSRGSDRTNGSTPRLLELAASPSPTTSGAKANSAADTSASGSPHSNNHHNNNPNRELSARAIEKLMAHSSENVISLESLEATGRLHHHQRLAPNLLMVEEALQESADYNDPSDDIKKFDSQEEEK